MRGLLNAAASLIAILMVPLAILVTYHFSSEPAGAACEAAQRRLSSLSAEWAHDPLGVAEALRPAWDVALSSSSAAKLELIDASAAKCCRVGADRCAELQQHAAPLVEFMARLRETVAEPRRRTLAQLPPHQPPLRVVVVGAGPAGLPAALLAHAEGAEVTVAEKRTGEGRRQVWFDLEPFEGGAQQRLRGWGFFALRPAHVPDENGSGVVTVQCATLGAPAQLRCSNQPRRQQPEEAARAGAGTG